MKKILLFLIVSLCFLVTNAQHQVKATKYYTGHGCGWRTADGSKINNSRVNSGADRWVALSPDMFKKGYKLGDTILIESSLSILNGKWVVRDKMGSRVRNGIDFLMTRENSKEFKNPIKVTITKIKK